MSADLLGNLARVQGQLQRLHQDIARATSTALMAGPGVDASGSVEIRLDRDGVAETIRVRADGLHRLDADAVGAMVAAADTAAAVEYGRAVADALAEPGSEPGSEPSGPAPEVGGAGGGQERPLGEMSERALTAFDRLGELTRAQPPVTGGAGPIRLTMTSGRITECVIDPAWLAGTDRPELARGLQRALTAARGARDEAGRPAAELRQDLSGLLADVKATLRSYTNPTAGNAAPSSAARIERTNGR
jgi:hypothetical protein